MSKITLPLPLAETIASLRAQWKAVHEADAALAAHNEEYAARITELNTDQDTGGDIVALAEQRAKRTAFRLEYEALATEKKTKLEAVAHDLRDKAISSAHVSEKILGAALDKTRTSRIENRKRVICDALSRIYTTKKSEAPPTLEAIFAPALKKLKEQTDSWQTPSTTELVRLLAEGDPHVTEVTDVPKVCGMESRLDECHVEAVAQFLENLPAEEIANLNQPAEKAA